MGRSHFGRTKELESHGRIRPDKTARSTSTKNYAIRIHSKYVQIIGYYLQ